MRCLTWCKTGKWSAPIKKTIVAKTESVQKDFPAVGGRDRAIRKECEVERLAAKPPCTLLCVAKTDTKESTMEYILGTEELKEGQALCLDCNRGPDCKYIGVTMRGKITACSLFEGKGKGK